MGYLAPAGTAMDLGDVIGGYTRGLVGTAVDAALGADIARLSGTAHAWPLSSGRAAMTTLCSSASYYYLRRNERRGDFCV